MSEKADFQKPHTPPAKLEPPQPAPRRKKPAPADGLINNIFEKKMIAGVILILILQAILLSTSNFLPNLSHSTWFKFSSEASDKPLYSEQCSADHQWAQKKLPGIKKALKIKVHGQPLAIDMVSRLINMHLRDGYIPSNALSLVFHGGTGTGKNFISHIVANYTSEKQMSSDYVHLWNGARLFTDSAKKKNYQETIREWVMGNISVCPYQLFIFDEVDKIPDGTLDILSSFLDHNPPTQDGVDYRRAIYIFLSNAGGEIIKHTALQYHESGKSRELIRMSDLELDLMVAAQAHIGGLKDTSILRQHLVSGFVPFLPLEESHVRQCVYDSLAETHEEIRPGIDQEKLVDEVMSEITFPDVFSTHGCKRVREKTNFIVERHRQASEDSELD